jgi:hypothetical protein
VDDLQWQDPSRSYIGFWVGDDGRSNYDLHSGVCQLLRRTSDTQYDNDLVYHSGDAPDGTGCIGGGSVFSQNNRMLCDDGGGCVVTNNSFPTNGGDPLWGWNYLVWQGGAPANNLFQHGARSASGLYSFWVR